MQTRPRHDILYERGCDGGHRHRNFQSSLWARMRDQGQNLQVLPRMRFVVRGEWTAACGVSRMRSCYVLLQASQYVTGRYATIRSKRRGRWAHQARLSAAPRFHDFRSKNNATGIEPRETEPGRRLLETTQPINVDSDWDAPESTSQDSMFDDLDATRVCRPICSLAYELAFQAHPKRSEADVWAPAKLVPNAAKSKKQAPASTTDRGAGAAASKYLVDRKSSNLASSAEPPTRTST